MSSADPLQRPLDGRVVLVTGGAVRLGRAAVLGFFRRGARVAFTYRSSEDRAQDLLAELRAIDAERGAEALAVECDVRDERQVDACFERLDERFGRLDVLINNAAIFERTPIDDMTSDDWRRHLDVNLTGPFLFAHRAAARMTGGDGGDRLIVNVACASSVRPWPGFVAYTVSKAGVLSLTQVLARALAPDVRVNAVAPGPVLPPESYSKEDRERAARNTALKREGSPDDVVRAMLFCWDSDYTTGALIPVEGGRILL